MFFVITNRKKSFLGSQAKIRVSGSDGYNAPKVSLTFSNGVGADVIIFEESDTEPPEEGGNCFFDGVVANQLGSTVKLIGCVQQKERYPDDQMTIILKAGIDSGWYSLYYATEHATELTVKKIRNKDNVLGNHP